jgi:hypothetical protein
MIIDSAILNGSFESGEVSPWSASSDGDSILAVQDGTFAYDGVWYAEIGIDRGRAFAEQSISAVTPTVLDSFNLNFQARKGLPGPESISARLSSRKIGGAPVSAKLIYSVVPQLSDTEWKYYAYNFQFDELWDPSQDLNVHIAFGDGWTSGSKGFLDVIVLEQIPEPSTLLILLFGFLIILFFRERKMK